MANGGGESVGGEVFFGGLTPGDGDLGEPDCLSPPDAGPYRLTSADGRTRQTGLTDPRLEVGPDSAAWDRAAAEHLPHIPHVGDMSPHAQLLELPDSAREVRSPVYIPREDLL